MRIVGGEWRGRRLDAPEGGALRPTSDRARESLFNMLEHGNFTIDGRSPIKGARVLDACCGTGAYGLEALSRGAALCVFMDTDTAPARANIVALAATPRTRLVTADVRSPPPAPEACDLVFLDPPYGAIDSGRALAALRDAGWIAEGALCCVETGPKDAPLWPAGFETMRARRYGKARITVLAASDRG
jgi:16S rRNA (guanine966-N2)-methyltransferase